ncbi:hypothetical protein D9611_005608 [Ephemerocybe angulata]|uniref:Uncharacterized protein n=1 Tax=Ephemerocybe angulata TaxID=980116 RepID=A0A8H5BIA3_9AGAR|nr:hypothetical protein D9611_005608 [Tulosesus angulatus]
MATWGVGQNDPSQEVLSLREKLASKDTAIASYETQLMRRSNDYDELKKLYDEAVNKLRAESEKALTLESDLQQCEEDLRKEKIHTQNIEATLNNAQQTAKEANMSTRDLEATLESLSHQSNTYQERCRILERDKTKLEERVRELQSLLSQSPSPSTSSKRKQSHRPRSSSLSNLRITNLETDISDTRANLQLREKELDSVTKKLAAAQTEANRLSNEKNTIEKRTAAQIAELEAALVEREEELAYLRDEESGGSREQELMERIEEDEAKISALEAMLRDSQDIAQVESKWKEAEARLQDETRRTQKLVQQQLHAKEEKEAMEEEMDELRSQIQRLELAVKGSRGRLSLTNADAEMDGPPTPPTEEDTTQQIPDEDTVEYIDRLLSAIDRLRAERDSLLRDVQFLESESRFTIEALEARLSRSMATTATDSDDTIHTINQLKMEMDALHSHLDDVQAASEAHLRKKDREITRLGNALTALGVVAAQWPSRPAGHPSQDTGVPDDNRVNELENRLDNTVHRLEATTSERDGLTDTLRRSQVSWEDELQVLRLKQQQSNRTIQDLSSEVDELTKTVEQIESERSSLVIHVKNLETDLQHAHDELATAESRYSDLQFHQLSSMSSTEATKNLRMQIKELEGRVSRRNEQLGIHQHDIKRLETNLRLQEERLNEMTSELEMMSAEKEAMVEDCADAREVRDEALRRVEEMEEATEALETSIEGGEETIISLIRVVADTVTKARIAISNSGGNRSNLFQEELHDTLDLVEELKEENAHMEHSVQMYNERINQLTAHIVNLEGQQAITATNTDLLREELESRSVALQEEVDALRDAKESLEESHSAATKELEGELDRLRHRLRDVEEDALQRAKEINSDQLDKDQGIEILQARLSELQSTLDDAEARHADQLRELHLELQAVAEARNEVEVELSALQDQLASVEAEHQNASSVLQAELVKERQNLKQAQQSFDSLEADRQNLIDDLHRARDDLQAVQNELDAQEEAATKSAHHLAQEMSALTAQIQELSDRLQEEQRVRQSQEQEHQTALSAFRAEHEEAVNGLQKDLDSLRKEIDQVERGRMAADEEKSLAQEQVTDLVAKLEQNKSLQRSLEAQIEERDRAISTLKEDIVEIQGRLNAAEQASAKATLNVSLLTAQHKRELTDAQRELERLRSKSNLEQITAELEERNQEMEELLKQKCAEIEENDDRALEMLKENKKLNAKVDSLTRKVQALQTKVTTLKASSPKADAKSGATSKASPSTTVPTSRPRSATVTSNQPQSQSSSSQSQRTSMPSTSTSRPLSRVASGPSVPSRPKTPERSRAYGNPLSSKTPEAVARASTSQAIARASTSPVGETESVAGKKRRAPDDFEVCDSMPPQAFTADSVPKDDTENRTPRVRRVLSSLQSGFTPVRTFARPVVPLPSPRRNAAPATQPTPYIADVTNSAMNVLPPLTFAPPSAGKSNKRSWLGKIRGAGSTQGMSRPQ